jgi:hypothetical protein
MIQTIEIQIFTSSGSPKSNLSRSMVFRFPFDGRFLFLYSKPDGRRLIGYRFPVMIEPTEIVGKGSDYTEIRNHCEYGEFFRQRVYYELWTKHSANEESEDC